MSKKLIIKCNEATSICDKTQYGESSTFDKLRLSIHNFLCHKCKLYSEQNKVMTKFFKVNLDKKHSSKCLHNSEKEKMEKDLQKELNK